MSWVSIPVTFCENRNFLSRKYFLVENFVFGKNDDFCTFFSIFGFGEGQNKNSFSQSSIPFARNIHTDAGKALRKLGSKQIFDGLIFDFN